MGLSVIIPVYNGDVHLKTCLFSVLNSSLKDIEIIIVDDASEDNSLKILKEYESKYQNIKVIHNDKNLGQNESRNIGLKNAKGEYVCFLDCDDYVHPLMYETMYNGAIKTDADLVTTSIMFVRGDEYANKDLGFISRTKGKIISPSDNTSTLLDISPSVCNKMFKRSYIEKFNFLNTSMFEDIALSSKTYICASKVLSYNNIDYFYRRDITNGVSSKNYKPNNHFLEIFKVVDDVIRCAKENGKYEIFKKEITVIAFSSCLKRVEEINTWDIDEEKKDTIKKEMFDLIHKKYGTLKDVPLENLSTRVSVDIIDEYNLYELQKQYKKGNRN